MKRTAKSKNAKGAPGTAASTLKVHAENRKLGLPVIHWQDGKVMEKLA